MTTIAVYKRDLKGVVEREKAALGALITLREPKEFPGRHPRLQTLTNAELLAGKKISFPGHRVETFAKAERKSKSQQKGLF